MARALRMLVGVMSSAVLVTGMATFAFSTPAAAMPNTWAIVSSPNTSTTQDNYPQGVSCPSPSFCVTAGYYSNGSINQTLIESWNGSAWSIASSPNVSTTKNNQLNGVSCPSPSFCVATGRYSTGTNEQTLIETWNGSAWSIASSPNSSPTQNNDLEGVSCLSPSSCVAVGNYSNGSINQTLIDTWNGSAWSIVSSPNTSTPFNNYLHGVSCTSPSSCVAAGDYYTGTIVQTLIETWNGSAWSIASSPDLSTTQNNGLEGVSCLRPSSCVAVGYYSNGTHGQTLIESWNGSAWSIASSPNTSTTQDNGLNGVSCTSPSSIPSVCVTVGSFNNGANDQTLIESMTGSATTAPVLGYWTDAADGGIFTFGQAQFHGSVPGILQPGQKLNKPVVGMAPTADGGGYWMDASDGGIFSFGNAKFYGSMGGQHLNQPVVGMAPTPDGLGYWLVASDGGIFSFGSAKFHGSTGGIVLNKPIVGMAVTPDGLGYWLVASDGGIFAFGSAQFYGSMGNKTLNKPMVGMAPTGDGQGYWTDASDGGIFSFGDAQFHGSMGGTALNKPMVGMASTPDGGGYWMDASDGGIFTFGDATFFGSMGGKTLNQPMVGMATFTQPAG